MTTLFCKWPANDKAGADAYNAQCGIEYGILGGEENAQWYVPREDVNGKWVVALMGPPWEFIVNQYYAEEASCAALRVGIEVSETPDWPIEED